MPRDLLERLVELAELGPTSNNALPMRVVFAHSPAAKERLRPALSAGNVAKTMGAPVTAIVAADVAFHLHRPERFADAARFRERYGGPDGAAAARAFATTNATLQGAYLMLAARALGLDAGPMGGFDRALVDAAFFAGTTFEALWLCNFGYADASAERPRASRLTVAEVATFV
ncbi:MAG: malonic semialdehyde reductase [Vulcanimicrobiaceae bacterium]